MGSNHEYSEDLYTTLGFMEYLTDSPEEETLYSILNYDEAGVLLGNNEPYDALNHDFLDAKNLDYSRRLTGGSVFMCRPEDIHFAVSVPLNAASGMGEFFEESIAECIVASLEESGLDSDRLSIRKDDRSVRYNNLPISGSSNQRANGRILYAGFISGDDWDGDVLDEITSLRAGERTVIDNLPSISDLGASTKETVEHLERNFDSAGFQNIEFSQENNAQVENLAEKYSSIDWLENPIEASGGERYRGFCPIMKEDLNSS